MVNKHIKWTWVFTQVLLFLFISFPGLTEAQAQKLEKYYTSSLQSGYLLYYITPSRIYEAGQCDCSFQYDLTYKSDEDSVTMNFSLWAKSAMKLSEIKLPNMNEAKPVKKIFIDKDKKDWRMRYSAQFARENIEKYFESEDGLVQLRVDDQKIDLRLKERKWKKYAGIYAQIFELIEINQ